MTTNKPQSSADRKKLERQRKRALGLVPKEVWCKPEDWETVKNYIEKLNKAPES